MIKFSSDSWHYIMAKRFHTHSELEDHGLCNYVRKVIISIFLFSLMVGLAGFVLIWNLGGIAMLAFHGVDGWQHAPFFVAVNFLSTLFIIFIVMPALYREHLSWRVRRAYHNSAWGLRREEHKTALRRGQKVAEKSLVMEWLRARKEKLCPSIKFVSKQ